MHVDRYELALALLGLVALVAAWLPQLLRDRALSLPLVLLAVGAGVALLPLGLPRPDPTSHLDLTERLTELGVVVSLMGAGLKLDRPLGWRRWGTTWRLLGVTMPLTIAAVAVLGSTVLGLGVASALLLGAVLAPTDPVLASDVQVGEPTIEGQEAPEEEDEVRFALTSEAGCNDALAFPFVYLALRLDGAAGEPGAWLLEWVAVDVVYRLGAGLVVGLLIGRLLAVVAFRPPGRLTGLADTPQGFVAIAATLLAYGATELVHGYGFLAVFVAAVTLRSSERGHAFHGTLHGFAEQAENLIVVGLLVALGGAMADGLLSDLGWGGLAVALAVVLVVRPLAGAAGLVGARVTSAERWAIAFLGIRGIGSIYYLAYASSDDRVPQERQLWSIAAATILASIVIHGVSSTPAMRAVDRVRRRARRGPRRRGVAAAPAPDGPTATDAPGAA